MARGVSSPSHKTIDMNTGLLSLLLAQGLRKEKKLVLGGTILKKGRYQSKYTVSLTQLKKTISMESLFLPATPVLLPRKSHGRRSLVGCSPWGH